MLSSLPTIDLSNINEIRMLEIVKKDYKVNELKKQVSS